MKLVIVFLSVAIFAVTLASPPHPCQCWENWTPIQEGGSWHCKDQTSPKTFQCNIDRPPICACRDDTGIVALPIGEVNCVGGGHNKFKNTDCDTSAEWDAWFNKNPQYRLHH